MLNVLVLGSLPGHVPGTEEPVSESHLPLLNAGRALGWALAEQNCKAIVGSTSPRTIDPYLVDGYKEFCRENPNVQRHVEVQYPSDLDDPSYEPDYGDIPPNLHLLKIENYADPSSPYRWIVSHFAALRSADALLVLGGGTSTRLVGSYAVTSRIPVVAIGEYGGSSADIFAQVRHTYGRSLPRLGAHPDRPAAGRVVEFLRTLVETGSRATHSYFLSYSWLDCAAADCVEVHLRRFGREVFRDEDKAKIGLPLPDQLQAAIQESDTFVALWSANYSASRWCPAELEFALDSNRRSGRPARITLIVLDDTPPPMTTAALLRVPGGSRELLDLGLRRLTYQE